ncbi:type II toxin-antitoxin system VapC family toxin [Candidatus Nitronereus thalassa]|uniref:Ribonuclease VapC n=1 Tax=Candidatus Nitronereus thalassa TaxID=3020898 RepID=A0ABU3KAU6_9BACT|nr:type II toxin-antitoxin system VapC family toxin [Candidatus Nitronereus thalassa]MDT7043472.1 type II toxin-antitoxin system VapC family toxin [Candidatus Nitronereus thalassa]
MVVDTMVFAYALLGVPRFRDESLAVLTQVDSVLVPDSFRAELVNVVWQWIREHQQTLEVGMDVLTDADALITYAAPADELWERALELSVEANHPAYDTLCVALAERENTGLITYDTKLRKKFQNQTISPSDFLSNLS